ncbi:MAG: 30S ribosomal protein S12 methylthiotransferase RimO [Candidatus Eisenbacteria bacterium]|nr:30S ribosomal protein S12 methylthiotransferase RimO [Candidatus Eisenbacteria bacterium]
MTPTPRKTRPAGPSRVGFVTLGCPKNLVDSERMLGLLSQAGFEATGELGSADVAVVNTCSFIDASRQESVQAILEVAELKKTGRLRRLVVTGCLAQRFGDELRREIPEIDALLGTGTEEAVVDACRTEGGSPGGVGAAGARWTSNVPRALSTPPHMAYLQVADGCSHGCAFCIIPDLRGKQKGRPVQDLVREARGLAASGVRELNLISQDLTAYGEDVPGGAGLATLLRELARVPGVEWLRLLYTHPARYTSELVELLRTEPKICNYVDMPLQHIDDAVLARMRRRVTGAQTRHLLRALRARVPGIAVRTTFIVGSPGESEEEFAALRDFVREAEFDHLGVFAYSPEEGTPLGVAPGQLAPGVKEARRREIMTLQRGISLQLHRRMVGARARVLVDRVTGRDEAVGRSEHQAPEIDGVTIVRGRGLEAGEFRDVTLVEARAYDWVADAN